MTDSTTNNRNMTVSEIMDTPEFVEAMSATTIDKNPNGTIFQGVEYQEWTINQDVTIMSEHEEFILVPGVYYVRMDSAKGGFNYTPPESETAGRLTVAWFYTHDRAADTMDPVVIPWRSDYPLTMPEVLFWDVVNPFQGVHLWAAPLVRWAGAYSDADVPDAEVDGKEHPEHVTGAPHGVPTTAELFKAISRRGIQQGNSAATNAIFSPRANLTNTSKREEWLEVTLSRKSKRKAYIKVSYDKKGERLLFNGIDRAVFNCLVSCRATGAQSVTFNDLYLMLNPTTLDDPNAKRIARGKDWINSITEALRQLDTTHYTYRLEPPESNAVIIQSEEPDEKLLEEISAAQQPTNGLPGEFDGIVTIEHNEMQNTDDKAPTWKHNGRKYRLVEREGSIFPNTIETYIDENGQEQKLIRFTNEVNSLFDIDQDTHQIVLQNFNKIKALVNGQTNRATPTTTATLHEITRRVSMINHRQSNPHIAYESIYNAVVIDTTASPAAQRKKQQVIRDSVKATLDGMTADGTIKGWREYTIKAIGKAGRPSATGVVITPKPLKTSKKKGKKPLQSRQK